MEKGRETFLGEVTRCAQELGIASVQEIDPKILVPEQWVRTLCEEDKCGNYGKNYTCPPLVGTLGEMKERLASFNRGILFQYATPVDVKGDRKGVQESKVDFHRKILELEGFFILRGIRDLWGMIGGSCSLCGVCHARAEKPCPQPEDARSSLESLGIAIIPLLEALGLDNAFHPDKITWTGCILFNPGKPFAG